MADVVYYSPRHKDSQISPPRLGEDSQVEFDSRGLAVDVDDSETNIIDIIEEAGAVRVDITGTEEALTPGTQQSSATCSAIVMRCADGASCTVNIREDDATGTVLAGPITIPDGEERVIIFPDTLEAENGIFVEEDSGSLDATPGFLLPEPTVV